MDWHEKRNKFDYIVGLINDKSYSIIMTKKWVNLFLKVCEFSDGYISIGSIFHLFWTLIIWTCVSNTLTTVRLVNILQITCYPISITDYWCVVHIYSLMNKHQWQYIVSIFSVLNSVTLLCHVNLLIKYDHLVLPETMLQWMMNKSIPLESQVSLKCLLWGEGKSIIV